MLWTVSVRHVAQGTKVVVQAIHTPPHSTSNSIYMTAMALHVSPNYTWN